MLDLRTQEGPFLDSRSPTRSTAERRHSGRAASPWVAVHVEEAYVHCSKHIPLLIELPKQQHWGTDDHTRKGGDFFHAASSRTSGRR